MQRRKQIGVRADDLGADTKRSLRAAAELAFTAVELSADRRELAPEELTESGRRHLARLVRNAGLAFPSLATASRGGGLADPAHVDSAVGRTGRVLQLAADMQVPIVSHDVGDLLAATDREANTLTEALVALAEQAERLGTIYAVRSRHGHPQEIEGLVRRVGSPLVRIAVDPAALIMSGFDPAEALATFGDTVVLAYVRDALRGSPEHPGHETALGEGRLDLDAYLAGLAAGGYANAPILRRTATPDSLSSIAEDKAHLDAHLPG